MVWMPSSKTMRECPNCLLNSCMWTNDILRIFHPSGPPVNEDMPKSLWSQVVSHALLHACDVVYLLGTEFDEKTWRKFVCEGHLPPLLVCSYETPWECEMATNCSYGGGEGTYNPLHLHYPHGQIVQQPLIRHTCLSTAPYKHPYSIGQSVHVCGGPQAFVSFVCDDSDGIASWVPIRNYPRTI